MASRTFNARRGRLSEARRDVLARLLPSYGLNICDSPLDPPVLFGRHAPLVLEIGSGMGEATAEMAAADLGRDYLAVEVHTAGVANLLALAEARGLTNLRIVRGDALHVVRHQLAPSSLAAIHVFFPDPWPKARHHKRRLIQPAHSGLLRSRLAVGGVLHCATDSAAYANDMIGTLAADPELVRTDAHPRPMTGYERRGVEAGRTVVDVMFRRVAAPA